MSLDDSVSNSLLLMNDLARQNVSNLLRILRLLIYFEPSFDGLIQFSVLAVEHSNHLFVLSMYSTGEFNQFAFFFVVRKVLNLLNFFGEFNPFCLLFSKSCCRQDSNPHPPGPHKTNVCFAISARQTVRPGRPPLRMLILKILFLGGYLLHPARVPPPLQSYGACQSTTHLYYSSQLNLI